METKICTKCKIEKNIYSFSKDKGQKSGFRPSCKRCDNAVQRIRMQKEENKIKARRSTAKWRQSNLEQDREYDKRYRQRPEVKERKRIRMAIWRKNNPEIQKIRANASYKRNFLKYKDTKNAKSREKYASDETFRKQLSEKAKRTWQENRHSFCKCCLSPLPKYSIKYCDKCRKAEYLKKTLNWQKKAGKEYLNDLQNKRKKRAIDLLTDGYIVSNIRGSVFAGIKIQDIPKPLIDLKRTSLQIKRLLKNQKS